MKNFIEHKKVFLWLPLKIKGKWEWFKEVGVEIDYRVVLYGYPPKKTYYHLN